MPIALANLSRSPQVEVLQHGAVRITGHTFETSYRVCGIDDSDAYIIQYLEERWHFFNKELYGGVMKLPPFRINNKKKTLGLWYPGARRMEFGKRMFKLGGVSGEKDLLGTLVHEMAHQYVTTVLHTAEKDAHGPVWQHVMSSIGMDTDDKYRGPELKSEVRVTRETEIRERLKHNAPLEDADRHMGIDKYTVFRYLNPSKMKDLPIIVAPTERRGLFLTGWEVKKDGSVNFDLKCTFATDYVVVPGPLKIRTPAYRAAQAKADELNKSI